MKVRGVDRGDFMITYTWKNQTNSNGGWRNL